eukprot:s2914_g7.t1
MCGRSKPLLKLLGDESVVTWGDAAHGGDSREVQDQLMNVQQIQSSHAAFAAMLGDGSVVTWGDAASGGDSSKVQDQLKNVQHVQASGDTFGDAFAAILGDGSVVTWGDAACGGDSSKVQDQLKNVQHIKACVNAFAAILGDGSVVTWCNAASGGDSSEVQDQLKNVQQIQASRMAFAAIRGDGSVVTWGVAALGGDSSEVQHQLQDVQHIQASDDAFAAILGDGSVVTMAPTFVDRQTNNSRRRRGTKNRKKRQELQVLHEIGFDLASSVTARALKSIRASAKAAMSSDGNTALEQMGLWYCRACITGAPALDADGMDASTMTEKGTEGQAIQSTWILGSLAQVLEFPLETYRPLPPWAEENSSDELRKIKAEVIAAEKARESAPKCISSATVGNVSHMEQRVQLPSNITNMPVVQSLEDLDLFYSEAPPPAAPPRPQPAAPSAPASASLEQVRLAAPVPPAGPVGTAVFGEDDESDEEEDDEDDWKDLHCGLRVQTRKKDGAPKIPKTKDLFMAKKERKIPTEEQITDEMELVWAPMGSYVPKTGQASIRWRRYVGARTVKDFYERGGLQIDLLFDLQRGYARPADTISYDHVFDNVDKAFLKHFKVHGYAVLRNALGAQRQKQFIDEFWKAMKAILPSRRRAKRESWKVPHGFKGIQVGYGLSQSDAAWTVRLAPRVLRAFAALFEVDASELVNSAKLAVSKSY